VGIAKGNLAHNEPFFKIIQSRVMGNPYRFVKGATGLPKKQHFGNPYRFAKATTKKAQTKSIN
jgi:hypothetical protein